MVSKCSRNRHVGILALAPVFLAMFMILPGALGRSLRQRHTQPLPQAPPALPAIPSLPAMSMLAFGSGVSSMQSFGGTGIKPMTQEEMESLPNPGDISSEALGASSVATLEASQASTYTMDAPPLVEDGSEPAVDDPPTDDDPAEEVDADASSTDGTSVVAAPDKTALMEAAPVDLMERATQEVDKQTAVIAATKPASSPPLVSMVVCAKAEKELKAMSCSLVTQISGVAEGCECRMKAKKCPAVRRDLGFTGVSPSIPFSPPQLGGASVILCMYWQWLPTTDRTSEDALAVEETNADAQSLVKAANFHAEEGAKKIATRYYQITPMPFTGFTSTFPIPTTPAPVLDPIRYFSTTNFLQFTTTAMPYTTPYRGMATTTAPSFMTSNPMFNSMTTMNLMRFGPAPGPSPWGAGAPAPAPMAYR